MLCLFSDAGAAVVEVEAADEEAAELVLVDPETLVEPSVVVGILGADCMTEFSRKKNLGHL